MVNLAESDLYEGAETIRTTAGWEVTRVFLVNKITEAPDLRLYAAATCPGLPVFGEAHPSIPDIYVQSIRPVLKSNDSAWVYVDYRPYNIVRRYLPGAPANIEIGGGLVSVETNLDRRGRVMTVEHKYDRYLEYSTDGDVREQPGMVTVEIPQTIFRITQKERKSPANKCATYKGKLNRRRFLEVAKRQLFCRDITGSSSDGGLSWDVVYEFQVLGTLADPTVVYIDEETGNPPIDLVEGVGIKKFEVYDDEDFGLMGIRLTKI